jgi:acyl-CoA thioester hydrolase
VSRPFRHRLRVRYAECDPQGVVFNAHYVTYFDTAITELWREAMGSYGAMLEAGTDIVVAEVRVRYLAPARFDDELDIGLRIARLGDTSMTTELTVTRAEDAAHLVEGELRHVFIDPKTGSKKSIPDDIREALAPYAHPVGEAVG